MIELLGQIRAPASLPAVQMPRERYQLECGAKLIVSRRPGSPVTAVRFQVRGGVSLDPPGKEGTAQLVGGLADQGTDVHDESELATLLEPAGGEIRGDSGGLSGTIVGASWKLLLEIGAEILTRSNYPKGAVERQLRRLYSRLEIQENDPRTQGVRRFRHLIYGDHWLGRSSLGSIQSVKSIKAAELRAHRRKYWVGKRTLIAVCGDVEPSQVRRHLDSLLKGLKPGAAYKPVKATLPGRAMRVDAFRRKREQVHVYLGHLGIRRKDPDYPALVVMDHVLGTGPGFTNRITRRLRDDLGLAYSVHADIHSSAGINPGSFTAYIGTSPEHVATAVDGFLQEMRRIQEEPVGADELQVAKDYLVGSFSLGFERASRRAGYLVGAELFGLPDDILEILPTQFARVTSEDVQRVARKHLFPEACCLSVAGPLSKRAARALLP